MGNQYAKELTVLSFTIRNLYVQKLTHSEGKHVSGNFVDEAVFFVGLKRKIKIKKKKNATFFCGYLRYN